MLNFLRVLAVESTHCPKAFSNLPRMDSLSCQFWDRSSAENHDLLEDTLPTDCLATINNRHPHFGSGKWHSSLSLRWISMQTNNSSSRYPCDLVSRLAFWDVASENRGGSTSGAGHMAWEVATYPGDCSLDVRILENEALLKVATTYSYGVRQENRSSRRWREITVHLRCVFRCQVCRLLIHPISSWAASYDSIFWVARTAFNLKLSTVPV